MAIKNIKKINFMTNRDNNNQIIIYNTENGETKIEVQMKDETVWLSQKQMAELFDCSVENIIFHLKNVFESSELNEKATTKDYLVVQKEGNREAQRSVKMYDLDAILKKLQLKKLPMDIKTMTKRALSAMARN